MHAAQHKIINLLKTFLSFVTKFYIKFHYLHMYIFYVSDHTLGTCLKNFEDSQKGHCIIRVIMRGHFCLPVVVDIMKSIHGPFFFAHQFLLVFVYLMCGPRQLFFFQCGPETPKGWTPLMYKIMSSINRDHLLLFILDDKQKFLFFCKFYVIHLLLESGNTSSKIFSEKRFILNQLTQHGSMGRSWLVTAL